MVGLPKSAWKDNALFLCIRDGLCDYWGARKRAFKASRFALIKTPEEVEDGYVSH